MKKNVAGQHLTFGLVSRADGTPILGASPTVHLTLDGGAQTVTANTPQEKGNGQYTVLLVQDETNADTIGFVALVGTAILAEKTIYTTDDSDLPSWVPPTGAGKTVGQCLDEARWILQDQSTNTSLIRYPTEQLLEYFNNATYEIRRIRPDLYIGRFGQALPLYTTSDLDLLFPFSMMYWAPVVQYIAGYAELRDDEFTVDGRAATLLNKFREQLTMVA